ncbi:MAG: diiron oxygenase [Phenylobacterium sp.]
MNAINTFPNSASYGRIVEASHAVQWDIDDDVIRGRAFDLSRKFLPDGLSLIDAFAGLSVAEKRFVSQVQGRTYANVFGLVERFITAKLLEVGGEHALGDQNALEALVRFSEEELKHQALFRRIDRMMREVMPTGYRFDVDPDAVARAVLGKRTWAVLLLTLHIELFVQNHYRQSIAPDEDLSELFRDVFLFHWKDECQHVLIDELELRRHDANLSDQERDLAVQDFIALLGAVDGILQAQAKADAGYFADCRGRALETAGRGELEARFLAAYRWQYIFSGASHARFQQILRSLVTPAQLGRIARALDGLK